MKKLIFTGLIVGFLSGCASGMTALNYAPTALSIIDSFYHTVLAAKMQPQTQRAATLILQQADALVENLQSSTLNQETATAQAAVLARQAAKL